MLSAINNWTLSKKMLMAFALISLFMTGIGITGVIANKELSAVATRHVNRGVGGTEALGRVVSALREHRIIVYSLATADTAADIAKYDDRFTANKTALKTAINDYAAVAGEFMPNVEALRRDAAEVEEVNARTFEARKTDGGEAALAIVKGEGLKASRAAITDGEDLIKLSNARSRKADLAGQQTARNALLFTVAQLIVALGALFVVWRLITSTVSKPLGEVSSVTKLLAEGGQAEVPHRNRNDELGEVAKAVELFRQAAVTRAETDARNASEQKLVTEALRDGLDGLTNGDLTRNIDREFPPAYAELKTNFNHALEAMRGLLGAVNDSAASIRTGSGEIAQASEDLARRTEGNAASLEETSASLVQIDGRLKATALAASRTVERADQAISTVGGGRAIADEAVQAMGRVSESAKGIDSVIEGLDKIAFQTRVLAMNAAVEAGRAGDAGRGFAVVADLVSALAMRAEEEAKRARDQLTVTQTDIVTAVDAVQKVDNALADISGDVGQVHELLGSMAADNQAQSSAITQISVAISTMDQSTQQNAAMVEQTSAAARNLTTEVTALTQQAARFKTGGATAAAPQRAALPRSLTAPKSYVSPVKALPASTSAPAMAGDDDWNAF